MELWFSPSRFRYLGFPSLKHLKVEAHFQEETDG